MNQTTVLNQFWQNDRLEHAPITTFNGENDNFYQHNRSTCRIDSVDDNRVYQLIWEDKTIVDPELGRFCQENWSVASVLHLYGPILLSDTSY